MRTNILFLFFISSLPFLYSCDKECGITDLTIKTLESEYGCVNTEDDLDINLLNTYIVIHSQSEFNAKVSGVCNPVIDFTNYDLLIGKKAFPTLTSVDGYKLTKDCTGDLKLKVTFLVTVFTQPSNLTYHVLIPKLAGNQTINVEMIIPY